MKKLKTAGRVFRHRGVKGIIKHTGRFVFIRFFNEELNPLIGDIYTGAPYDHVKNARVDKSANKNWLGISDKKRPLTFSWLMPPPGKGSGGHMTLFRFIQYLENAGHTCKIYFHNPSPSSSVQEVEDAMGDAFPAVKAKMQWLQNDEEMDVSSDAIFATSWQTAYTVRASKVHAKKLYFVQDFEPYFYPVGGLYTLAENTYKLGFRGFTAGGWLEKKLAADYDMETTAFWFGSDSKTYRYINNTERKEVVFYARPTTERRAFELGVLALDIFHKKHPEYQINFIGWDTSSLHIPFPYKNRGILTPDELNEVYNKSAASLVMSLTNMSLLPLELLSSGCIPVVTDGDNNRQVSDNKYIAYSAPDPHSLAAELSKTVSRADLIQYAKKASLSVENTSWDESGRHFVKTVEKSVRSKGNL
jgi:hypothetical protein